jgi:putative ABC transport system permease protein
MAGNGVVLKTEMPYPFATAVKMEVPEAKFISRVINSPTMVFSDDLNFNEFDLAAVDSNYFDIFNYEFVKGERSNVFRNPNSMVITEDIAKKYFGDHDPIGKVLRLENGPQYIVSYVVKYPPNNTSMDINMFVLAESLYKNTSDYNDWYSHFLHVYIYVPEPIDIGQVEKKLSEVLVSNLEDPNPVPEIKLQALSQVHLYNLQGENQRIQYICIFSSIALIILIIASINYTNIASVQALGRSKEVGIKKVVGLGRGQLCAQFFGETFIQSFLALLLAMMLVELVRPAFNELTGKEIMIHYSNVRFLLMLFALPLVGTLLAGSYPAIYLSSIKPIDALKGNFASAKGQGRFRRILVIFQFSASIVLIVSVLFIYKQLRFINNKDLGFEKENIVYAYIGGDLNEKFDAFKSELMKNPGIVNVCRCSQLPNKINYGMYGIEWEGKVGEESVGFNFAAVDFDFIETTGLEIIEGRSFSREYSLDSFNYILNEAAVKLMGIDDPVGKRFDIDNEKGKIIGVLKNFHSKPLMSEISPTFLIIDPSYYVYVMVRIRPENSKASLEHIEQVWNSFLPLNPPDLKFFNDRIDYYYQNEKMIGKLAGAFTIVVILISCMGLFGLASHTAQRKAKEISIRKVFGASAFKMMLMFTKIFAAWVLIANLIAWPFAYWFVSSWLQNFAYRIDIGASVFLVSAAIALLIAIITVGSQSYRAASKNPADVMRYE